MKRRVLFVAEAVTLAHAARPIVLAEALHPEEYDVTVAWDPRYAEWFPDLDLRQVPITSMASDRFLEKLASGSPIFNVRTLRASVNEDLKILKETAPDVVVGDFRLSLAISARVLGVRYMGISNVYWSPYARVQFPIPELPLIRLFGVAVANKLFRMGRPLAFAYHALPFNRVRREFGLPTMRLDLRSAYTDADYVLYADVPSLIPTLNLPSDHHYLGPILWSPSIQGPDWWDELPVGAPAIYVALGSSGKSDLLPVVLEALADIPVSVIASTAGRVKLRSVPSNAFVADLLPGKEAAMRSDLVICNGGSSATYQALAEGKPVLGIASNMDQYLNMESVCRVGAGELLRAGKARKSEIQRLVMRMLREPRYPKAAQAVALECARFDAPRRFQSLIDSLFERPARPPDQGHTIRKVHDACAPPSDV